MAECPEEVRLAEDAGREKNWKRWGPYLAERQWGTVREDYSPDGSAWTYFPHEHSRSRAYRWGEDGLLGICDRECRLCFSVALWNGQDPILKERLFGLTNQEGNHGEDVKELYSYLDSTPTHSYMKALYRYPQGLFPYERLVEENRRRSRSEPEFELSDTGIFDGDRYFDLTAEYAKAGPDDLLIRLTAHNRGPEAAKLHLLPTLWFRNTWIWGCRHEGCTTKPRLEAAGPGLVAATHESLGRFTLRAAPGPDGEEPKLLFTENETNTFKLFGVAAYSPYVKDAFHDFLINGKEAAVNPKGVGTKMAAHYLLDIPAGGSASVTLRLGSGDAVAEPAGPAFDELFALRAAEAEEFYAGRLEPSLSPEERRISRLAYAGLLWSRQFYHLVVEDWLRGDPAMPPPPQRRREVRNSDWGHLFCRDILCVPDKWEYPWFAAWDTAFQMVAMARVDASFAKRQLILMLREWYQHPNGAMPAYEYNFSDVNPPVHAWACWRVYKIAAAKGGKDRNFLASAFQKLLVNFTWWVNRKDASGRHIFSGGFLGLDNVGVFDRSQPLPGGGVLEQADATAWMAFYAGTMFSMALELAAEDPVYQDMASKFFEHFIAIADAMNQLGGSGLWHEQDGFYYDQISQHGQGAPLRVRSMVGLIPLLAVESVHADSVNRLPGFKRRLLWFLRNRRDLAARITFMKSDVEGCAPKEHMLLAMPSRERLERVLRRMLDEAEFLSPYGIRSLSKAHADNPYSLQCGGAERRVGYVPGESETWLFGGNSNWRGPVWFPVNYLLAEALERYHHFYGDSFTVEYPTGSGRQATLGEVAADLHGRLAKLFVPGPDGRCPYHGADPRFAVDPHWRDVVCFHEFFDGDTGRGLGASHQTGWTSLVAASIAHKARSSPLSQR